jgi:hypothetical protein
MQLEKSQSICPRSLILSEGTANVKKTKTKTKPETVR